jgi:hypothetical protein
MAKIDYEASAKIMKALKRFMTKAGYKLEQDMSTDQDIPYSLSWMKGG